MRTKAINLGVNIDHIATLRQQRHTTYPDPIQAAKAAEAAGADNITLHLREDRRHIQDRDVFALKEAISIGINFEMAISEEIIVIAEQLKPTYVCLVPEKRNELTTEGGLDVISQIDLIQDTVDRLMDADIRVSLFIDPDEEQIEAAKESGAKAIELHTGCYADTESKSLRQTELERLQDAAKFAHEGGLIVNAGHGLHYENVQAIARIPQIVELNIGHAIISRAVFVGISEAVKEMKDLMLSA